MTHNHHKWEIGEPPPPIKLHSQVKHQLLYDYLVDYFLTLIIDPRQDTIRLTIVDGFCGGGLYTDAKGNHVPGSPLIILKAIQEAEARVSTNKGRHKPLQFEVKLIFIDKDKRSIHNLNQVLELNGYGEKLRSGEIITCKGEFSKLAEKVFTQVRERSPIAGRSIFILDQYGYKNVPLPIIKSIFNNFRRAEVILNFNVDSLLNFLSPKNARNFETKTGIIGAIPERYLRKENRLGNWRFEIQSNLYQNIVHGSGAKYFTPFFIRPEVGHGEYWLIHLSQHETARDVMAATHWRNQNHFAHYGGPGFNMFSAGYVAKIDDRDKPQPAFVFDSHAEAASLSAMEDQIPRIIHHIPDGMKFDTFFSQQINSTPATKEMVKQSVLRLAQEKEIILTDDRGRIRNPRLHLDGELIIKPYPIGKLFG